MNSQITSPTVCLAINMKARLFTFAIHQSHPSNGGSVCTSDGGLIVVVECLMTVIQLIVNDTNSEFIA